MKTVWLYAYIARFLVCCEHFLKSTSLTGNTMSINWGVHISMFMTICLPDFLSTFCLEEAHAYLLMASLTFRETRIYIARQISIKMQECLARILFPCVKSRPRECFTREDELRLTSEVISFPSRCSYLGS